jgi:hypothetical protein
MTSGRPKSPPRKIRNSLALLIVCGALFFFLSIVATLTGAPEPEGSLAWWRKVLWSMLLGSPFGILTLAALVACGYFSLRTLLDPKTWRAWWLSRSVQDDDPGGGPKGMPEFLRSDQHPRE